MNFKLIDYSLEYYGEGEGKVPAERGGKFIQVRGIDTEYLVLSPGEQAYFHANIVEKFFLSVGITGKYNPKGDVYMLNHPDWVIVGGGLWSIKEVQQELSLLGASQAYGKFDSDGLRERILSVAGMASYKVRISVGH